MLSFLGGTTITTAACMVGEVDPLTASTANVGWKERAAQLEMASGTLYSAASEGRWTGKAGTHVATMTKNPDGSITVSATHGMVDADVSASPPVAQHWITTLYVRDVATETVIHLVEFVTRGPEKAAMATTTFTPSTDIRRVRLYAYCNQHDLWISEDLTL